MHPIIDIITNDTTSLYLAIASVALTILYYCYNRRSLPPGPTGLPYFGMWPFWKNEASHLQLHEFGKKYGDVFSFSITGQLYVNLGTHKVLKEAMITKASSFPDRPQYFSVAGMLFQGGLIFFNGDKWRTFRKFFSQQFRECGMNSLKTDGDTVLEALKDTIDDLYKSKGEPVEVVGMLIDKCTNILHTTAFGGKGITIEEIRELHETYGKVFTNIGSASFFLTGNIARFLLLPFMPSYWTARKHFSFIKRKLYEIIERHKATSDERHTKNLIDLYLNEKKLRESKNDPTAKYFTDKALMATLTQIISDGVTAVATAIATCINALLEHPEEQEKIYQELMEVIGSDREPCLGDKNKLPYTNAFIMEVMRMTDLFPFFPDMECKKDTIVGGYRIPKGAVTIMNIWSCHYDPNEYEEPEKFNPARFLPVEGKKKLEQPILFGLGKRACLGEGYTLAQVFLFLTTIVKHFRLTKPTDTENKGLLFLAGTIHVCAHPRSNKVGQK